MYSPVSIRNGTKLPMPKPRSVIGAARFRDVVRALNGLLNPKVTLVDSVKASITISEGGVSYDLPRSGLSSSTVSTDSGAKRYRVKGVYSTYLVCRTWDGSTEGASDVYIAKPPHLRWYASSWPGMTIIGTSVTFTWSALTDNIDGKRTAHDGTNPDQIEIVCPVWQYAANGAGISGGYDEIWADTPTGGTGVTTVSESAYSGAASPASASTVLTLMDDNRNGRYWEQIG
jgi:hypothetical protein